MFAQGLVTPVIKNLESKNLAEAAVQLGRNMGNWPILGCDPNETSQRLGTVFSWGVGGSNWEGWICCMGRNGVEWCVDTLDFNMYTIVHTLLITNYIALHNMKLHTYNIQYYTIIYICRLHVDR